MLRHLATCAPAHDPKGPRQRLVHLRFEAAGDSRYWIHVEARGDATLRHVDSLLRHVWLECCGHMSAFLLGRGEAKMGSKVASVFGSKGLEFGHDYDFGSTTSLKGQVLGTRDGSLGREAARLLARNDPLVWQCAECAAPATIICPFCLDTDACLFCDTHSQKHPCAKEEVYLPVVNSPRMGVCGYTGDA
jgi:hypothetical protein